MSFTRYMLAELGLAYVPKVGAPYRYASEGPFAVGPLLVPKQIKDGHVLYELSSRNGASAECACTVGAFASMCREL